MKSIKPGRAPSMMGGVMSVAMGIFGLIWTVVAARMGGGLFALFGVVFIVIAVVQAVYHFRNATGKERYSSFDVVDRQEEDDPLNRKYGPLPGDGSRPGEDFSMGGLRGNKENGGEDFRSAGSASPVGPSASGTRYCPYCGADAEVGFQFCKSCGKRLPQ